MESQNMIHTFRVGDRVRRKGTTVEMEIESVEVKAFPGRIQCRYMNPSKSVNPDGIILHPIYAAESLESLEGHFSSHGGNMSESVKTTIRGVLVSGSTVAAETEYALNSEIGIWQLCIDPSILPSLAELVGKQVVITGEQVGTSGSFGGVFKVDTITSNA